MYVVNQGNGGGGGGREKKGHILIAACYNERH